MTAYVKDLVERPVAITTTTGASVVTRTYNYAADGDQKSTTVTTSATGVVGNIVQTTISDLLGRTVSSSSPGPDGTPEI